jgi:hypothetical protein
MKPQLDELGNGNEISLSWLIKSLKPMRDSWASWAIPGEKGS